MEKLNKPPDSLEIVDIGSGDCRWFSFLENYIYHYYGIDTSDIALSLAPKHPKLTIINKNIFQDDLQLSDLIKPSIDIALFSFFLSHFSDRSIQKLIGKLEAVNSLIIIDSFWGIQHQEKYITKELKDVKRMTSQTEYINLPKRFFAYSDIKGLLYPFKYSICRFHQGHYSFACMAKRFDDAAVDES